MKLMYVLAKARRVARRMAARFARAQSRERPLDHAMREVEEARLRVLRAYVPRPCSSQVTLFLTRKRRPSYGDDAGVGSSTVVTGGFARFQGWSDPHPQ